MGTKKCSNCFQVKPLDQFYRKLNRHQSRCKLCNAEVVRGYMQRRKEARIAERWRKLRAG